LMMTSLIQVAYHEAGHVVASIPTVGYPARATIRANRKQDYLGIVQHRGFKVVHPDDLKKVKDGIPSEAWDPFVRNVLSYTLAGYAAEVAYLRSVGQFAQVDLGRKTGTTDSDVALDLIELMYAPASIESELARIGSWIAENWAPVERVAKALLRQKTLGENDIRRLVSTWLTKP